MGFLSITIAYTIRTALSFAITKMVNGNHGDASALECAIDSNGTDSGSSEVYQPILIREFK